MVGSFVRGLAAAAALAALAQPALAQDYVIKVSSPTIHDVTEVWMTEFKKGVEERSGGKIAVELYPANQLGQIPATVEGVALGTIEVTAPASGFFVGLDPRFEVFDIPGVFDDMGHAARTLSDPAVRAHFATLGNEQGMEPLVVYPHGPMMLLSDKAVRTPDDFKGQKIRTPGATPIHVLPLEALGASPLSMPLGEVLPAMQNHVINGQIASSAVFTAFKFYDVAKPLTTMPNAFLIVAAMANSVFLDSLGDELEAIVHEEAERAIGVAAEWNTGNLERTLATWTEHGGELITFSPDGAATVLAASEAALPKVFADNPAAKEDYEFLKAAADKTRQ